MEELFSYYTHRETFLSDTVWEVKHTVNICCIPVLCQTWCFILFNLYTLTLWVARAKCRESLGKGVTNTEKGHHEGISKMLATLKSRPEGWVGCQQPDTFNSKSGSLFQRREQQEQTWRPWKPQWVQKAQRGPWTRRWSWKDNHREHRGHAKDLRSFPTREAVNCLAGSEF